MPISGSTEQEGRFVLLDAVTTDQLSSSQKVPKGRKNLRASMTGTGAISATVNFYGNDVDDAATKVLAATKLLSGTGAVSDGYDIPAEWYYWWSETVDITGTGAAVTAVVSV